MAWWTTAIIQAAPYIYSGVSGWIKGKDQASNDRSTALSNSIALNAAGDANAKSILATGLLQVGGLNAANNIKNAQLRAINTDNAENTIFMHDYNAELLENEAFLIWEGANLDLEQLGNHHDSELGRMRVAHGASGAIMDQDSSADAQRAAEETHALERLIIRRGADIQARKLIDGAAMSRWEGRSKANQLMFQGSMMELTNNTNTALATIGINAQAGIDAKITKYNYEVRANQTVTTGYQSADNNDWAASSSMMSGLFGAGTSVGASYLREKGLDQYDGADAAGYGGYGEGL